MKKNKLFNHLKKTVSTIETRPVLRCAHYDKDGSVTVTDSRRLIRINDFHEHKSSFNIDLYTMELIEKNYPDVTRLIPNIEKEHTKVTISLSGLLRVASALKTNATEMITFDLKEEEVIFRNKSDQMFLGMPIRISVPAQVEGEVFEITFSGTYLIDCCKFLTDAKGKKGDLITFHMTSPISPALICLEEGKYQYLLTPIRTTN